MDAMDNQHSRAARLIHKIKDRFSNSCSLNGDRSIKMLLKQISSGSIMTQYIVSAAWGIKFDLILDNNLTFFYLLRFITKLFSLYQQAICSNSLLTVLIHCQSGIEQNCIVSIKNYIT